MNIFKRLVGSPAPEAPAPEAKDAAPPIELRPLLRHAPPQGTAADIAKVMKSPEYAEILRYFALYPGRSLMSDHSRAVLFSLTCMMRPKSVAEIGTLHAGTTEVFARALWQNGDDGVVHSADPFGGERCPAIIAQWQPELQRHVQYYAKSSMDFFAKMSDGGTPLDLVLVDGNHDYEYALFDLQMAARLMRPGGVVVMDNAEQAGPFKATRAFLAGNPAWRELGDAVAAYNPFRPFDRHRASLPDTTFLVLQAPAHVSIGPGPQSWGQAWTLVPRLSGLRLEVVEPSKGTLIYQVHLRGFADGNRWVKEERVDASLRIDADTGGQSIDLRFERPLVIESPYESTLYTIELDLSWQADPGSPNLALAALPTAITD